MSVRRNKGYVYFNSTTIFPTTLTIAENSLNILNNIVLAARVQKINHITNIDPRYERAVKNILSNYYDDSYIFIFISNNILCHIA